MSKKKKIIIIISVSVLVIAAVVTAVLVSDNRNTYTGISELTDKAREEMPISDAENADISFIGQCKSDDKVLMWFISGNEYQSHCYLPMECTAVGKNQYKFKRTYKPHVYSDDIAVIEWENGYAFVINDPDCTLVHIENAKGYSDRKTVTSYPYVFYYDDGIPTKYTFYDSDGKEIS